MIDSHFHYRKETEQDFQQSDMEEIQHFLELHKIEKCLLHVIDERWKQNEVHKLIWPEQILPGYLMNPLESDWKTKLDELNRQNCHFIKILPYEQKILRKDYNKVLELARCAGEYNMCLVICGAYGSELVYETNGVELVAYLLNHSIKTPVIIAHGGMVRVLDSFSLMEAYPNVYLDISFALPYWMGSSVIMDYAFVIKRMAGKRIFYGTDYPYVTMEESLNAFEKVVQDYQISNEIKDRILHRNFEEFLMENGWN